MDLPQIGAHCSLDTCNILDFLPIKCRCNKFYCSAHINPDHHACLANPTTALSLNVITGTDKFRVVCALHGCEKASLGKEETCSACHRSFCVNHRHPETHSCSLESIASGSLHPKEPKKTLQATGLSLSKRSFQARHKKIPTDPFKFAQYQKMESLKMRQRASPGDSKENSAFVPPDQRLHLRILIDDVERVFWFRKTMVTGKALDLISVLLKVAPYDTQARQLCKILPGQDEYLHLRNDLPLIDQVEDGSIVIVRLMT
ncbi:hypothetical protein BYT27DRAFT_7109719 [Phlegmacium glaucopus]|nr:hypothetical protein BYT27DRAFT_7109719 [Phlegmacium glaucopus]